MKIFELKNSVLLFLISFFYVSLKYFLSFIEFPEEELILKIIRFTDKEYVYLVESFSRLDFSTDWSKFEISDRIIGFPVFSILMHAIFFKFFGYYTFFILEIIFFFLIIYLLFLILTRLNNNKVNCIIGILLLLIICQVIELGKIFKPGFFAQFNPIIDFIGLRFPRPLATGIFTFLFILNLIIFTSKSFLESKKNIYLASTCLALLANSFFHLFFIFSVLTFFVILHKFIYEGLDNLKSKIKILLMSFLIVLIGVCIFFVQQFFSEPDYANRIGVHYLSLNDKYDNALEFVRIFSQLEYILLLIICLTAKFYFKKKFNNTELNNFFLVLLFFVISSFISPIIFVILSNKVIVSHHFLTITKFALFLFIFTFFFFLTKKLFNNKLIAYSLVTLLPIFLICNFYYGFINLEKSKEEKKIYKFLNQKNYINSEKVLYANDFFDHVWFSLGNKYISVPSGFSSSLRDDQIENLVFYLFKTFNVTEKNFNEKIDNRDCARECFAASYFNYKYVVNKIRHYKPIDTEYSETDVKKIKAISEIDWWYTIIPLSEKKRLKERFKKLNFDKDFKPDLIILNYKENLYFERELSNDYLKVFDGKFYTVFEKNNSF